MKPLAIAYWLALFLGIVAELVLIGGILGALLFPFIGTLIGYDATLATMAKNGARDGAFWFFVWAPGISFVTCAHLLYRRISPFAKPSTLTTSDATAVAKPDTLKSDKDDEREG